ncbi:50S ribosomal protein L25, partial [Neobacillus niacini]
MNTLVAQERKDVKKSTLKTLRNEGEVPAIVYGRESNTESIFINYKELRNVIRKVGRYGIISLNLNETSKNVILRDYQSNPVTKDL